MSAEHISLHAKDGSEALRFMPMFPGSTVYWLHSAPPTETVKQISFDIAHRRFAHPGNEVLRRFKDNTLGAPDFEVLPPKSPCQGCAKGKTPQRPYPATDRRANKPFQLIHSDLKSFPVESYYRHKYAITFFDDYTSNAWVVNMRKKSQALAATRQFLAMVDTQYHAKVEQWMSDAGGEYKSEAFDKLDDYGQYWQTRKRNEVIYIHT